MFFIERIFRPEIYQGRNKKSRYFEGWYYKQVSYDGSDSIAFIPGVSLDEKDSHAFIQVIIINNKEVKTLYYRFLLSEFSYSDKPFRIQIGENVFTKSNILIDIKTTDVQMRANIKFSDITSISKSIARPNIMGFFGYLSFMECYHGVISMGHECSGYVDIDKKIVSYDKGRGYIEKDWGRSFPKEYFWMQCNHFNKGEAKIMLSIANIPFLGTEFKGFICILIIGDNEYRFATYTGAKLTKEKITDKAGHIQIKQKKLILNIEASIENTGILQAPYQGNMGKTIKEGLSGKVRIKLETIDNEILYEDYGISAGIDIVIA